MKKTTQSTSRKLKHQQTRAWTDYWLRHLPWRKLLEFKRMHEEFGRGDDSLRVTRTFRVDREWERRKREKHGGTFGRATG